MTQLFQPTNITPDSRGAFGNGVVTIDGAASFLEDVCTVSWQVNGNTPMTAFRIDFTDMDGNALYSTGKLTYRCPFYGTNQSGNISLFSYNIIQDDISTSFLRRASEGLMRITQWWGNGENDFIVQLSPSHYIVRQPLVAYWTRDGGSPATSRNASFTGSFTGAETDGLMWIRWVLESITYESGRITSRQTVKDTGRLYGSVNPVFSYDGFLPGDYWLTLSGETSAGVVSELGEDIIHVVYDLSDVGVPVTASRDCNGESAVSVSWPRLWSIPVQYSSGTITDNGTKITLSGPDSSLYWSVINDQAMRLGPPWSVVWKGEVTALSGPLFQLKMVSGATYEVGVGTMSFGPSAGKGILYLKEIYGVQERGMWYISGEWESGPLTCVMTHGRIYWKYESDSGTPLYPSEHLFPGETLYPGGLSGTKTLSQIYTLPDNIPESGAISRITLLGPSSVYGFEVIDHNVSEAEANNLMSGNTEIVYGDDSLFCLVAKGATQDYNAGNFPEVLRAGTAIRIYRKNVASETLEYVGWVSVNGGNKILDYAAKSQQGPYVYYMYIMSGEKYINSPAISNEVNPCFWNWSVLSCVQNADGSFRVRDTYLFGKNLQSGSVTNNNQPGIFKNFTPYPTVMTAPQNYRSGTLQSLIGVIKDGEYSDTIAARDAIYALSTTTNALFLKNRKGDLLRIRPSGEISMETMDNTRQQAQTVSFPWVEVGDASDVAIYSLGDVS